MPDLASLIFALGAVAFGLAVAWSLRKAVQYHYGGRRFLKLAHVFPGLGDAQHGDVSHAGKHWSQVKSLLAFFTTLAAAAASTLPVTCPTATCPASAIQSAINTAVGGDTITIQAGVLWTSPGRITLKSGMTSTVTIRTSTPDSLLPANNQRITPAYAALLPNIQLTGTTGPLFQIEQSTNRTQNYSFVGIQFSSAPNLDTAYSLVETWYAPMGTSSGLPGASITKVAEGPPVVLTMSSTAGFVNGSHVIVNGIKGATGANGWWTLSNVTPATVQLSGSDPRTYAGNPAAYNSMSMNGVYDPAMTPDHISFDRCLFIGDPLSGIRQAVRLAGSNLTVKNSYCDGIKAQADSQCISMPTTPGPVLVDNNFMSAAGEVIITGGAISNLPGPDGTGQNVSDLTITNNVLYKDPAALKLEKWSAAMWVRKGKVIDGGNSYRYIAMTSGTTGPSAPAFPAELGTGVTDGTVTWQRNWFTLSPKWNCKNLLEFKNADRVVVKWNTLDGNWLDGQNGIPFLVNGGAQGYVGLAKSQHVEFGNNVIRHTPMFFSANSGQDYGDGLMFDLNVHDNLVTDQQPNPDGANPTVQLSARANVPPYLAQLRIAHNTVERGNVSTFFKLVNGYVNGGGKYDAPAITDNLLNMTGTAYAYNCSTCPTTIGPQALTQISTGLGATVFAGNVAATQSMSGYPGGNYGTAWTSIGFTDTARHDYSLGAASPYKNAGTDGKDLGADAAQLPQIKNLAVTTTPTTATLSWAVNSPQQAIPCVAEVSPDASFASYVPDLDPAASTRPDVAAGTGTLSRTITVGSRTPLAPSTTYAWRLHCGGAFEYGSFTTAATPAPVTKPVTLTCVITGEVAVCKVIPQP